MKTPVMEDSPSKRIEFLRAQLFSERSVSQTARQRVDELAKRVAELEAQLKVVSLQRKKAEKATVTVLAILENLGKSDVSSEGFDSGSEQGGALCESNVSDNKDAHNEMFDGDACSSSEIGSSASCRWIGHVPTRSVAEESCNDSSVRAAFDNAVASFGTESLQGCLEHQNEKGQVGIPALQVSKNQSHMGDSNLFCKLEDGKDLESALEHQAQLIGQYEAEERAQREWEEKYGEGASFMRDSGENHSDVTEERDETKAPEQPCSPPRAISTHFSGAQKSPNGFQSPVLAEETSRETSGLDSPSEFTFPKGNHEPVHSEHTGQTCHKPLRFSSLPVNPIEHASSSFGGSSLRKGEDSREGYELALKSHTTGENVQPVLHALEQVKLSLKQKLNISPQIESRLSIKALAPSTHSGKIGEKVEIPVGCPALHQLPLCSPSQFSSVNHSPEPVPSKFYPNPFLESRSIASISTSQSTHIGSRNTAWSPMLEPAFNTLPSSSTSRFNFLNPHLSSVIPFSSNYTVPSIPTYPFSPNLMPRLPSPEGFSATFPSRETGMPLPTRFSPYNEHIRSNMHR
ncbi:PREDICTED: uncharacterized protein LOC109176873 isoform X2 [Ipomoea nil]|uniref:uncharacterized protein LOC109176873 isoform X2 n=1 Tax=Ipomoea nil TaxID=35883 RepID=UPI000900C8A9|nr:PREDICTED: uncharacterized protein LOC109176873 isoform X2 [Ipomoea nil]